MIIMIIVHHHPGRAMAARGAGIACTTRFVAAGVLDGIHLETRMVPTREGPSELIIGLTRGGVTRLGGQGD